MTPFLCTKLSQTMDSVSRPQCPSGADQVGSDSLRSGSLSESNFEEAGLTKEGPQPLAVHGCPRGRTRNSPANMLGRAAPRQCIYDYTFTTVRGYIDFMAKLMRWAGPGTGVLSVTWTAARQLRSWSRLRPSKRGRSPFSDNGWVFTQCLFGLLLVSIALCPLMYQWSGGRVLS